MEPAGIGDPRQPCRLQATTRSRARGMPLETPARPASRAGRGFDWRDQPEDEGHRKGGLRLLAGGAGGNRTRVRKSSTGSSTCLAGLFGFNPVLGQSAGLHAASRLGSRSASSDPMHVRFHVNGAANRGSFRLVDPTHGQIGAASSRSYAARAKRSSLAFTWFPVGFRSSLVLRMPCICFLTHVETRSAPGGRLYARRARIANRLPCHIVCRAGRVSVLIAGRSRRGTRSCPFRCRSRPASG